MSRLDRRQLRMYPLAERKHKLRMADIAVRPDTPAPSLPAGPAAQIRRAAERVRAARDHDRPVVLTFGAHLIKNGLAPVVNRLVEDGWVTHVATNGAGSIHDWEFAYLGLSTEDVRANTAQGRFGTWDETGRYTGLAVAAGGAEGLGYGESMGRLIEEDGLAIPTRDELRERIAAAAAAEPVGESLGALADLLHLVTTFDVPAGRMAVPHPWKEFSVQATARRRGVPFTVHPGVGYDIVYTHPMVAGGPIGRGAVRDFLSYADTISRLSGGVHLAVGSAIMAPMVFEKSLSMANNLAMQRGEPVVSDHYLVVVDIQEGGDWDWSRGEPPMDHAAYYLRFCKTFYRMGGTLDYVCLDNRGFLLGLWQALNG
jgi:hypothetical protein